MARTIISSRTLTGNYISITILRLILGVLGVVGQIQLGLFRKELEFLAEADVTVGVKSSHVLNETLNRHRRSLAVLLAVLPFLKCRHVSRRVIQEAVGRLKALSEKAPERRPN